MLVCHMLIGFTLSILLLIMTSLIDGVITLSNLMVSVPLEPMVRRLMTYGFVGAVVGAYGLFIFFVGSIAVLVSLATYRMLVCENPPHPAAIPPRAPAPENHFTTSS